MPDSCSNKQQTFMDDEIAWRCRARPARASAEMERRSPQDEHEDEEAHWGEVAVPFDSEEVVEPEAIGEAIRALRMPSHTPEQLAQLDRLAEIVERNERYIAELMRQVRQRATSANHGPSKGHKEPPER